MVSVPSFVIVNNTFSISTSSQEPYKNLLLKCETPGSYSRVPYYYDWINNKIDAHTSQMEDGLSARVSHFNNRFLYGSCDEVLIENVLFTITNDGTETITSLKVNVKVDETGALVENEYQAFIMEPIEPGVSVMIFNIFDFDTKMGENDISIEVSEINGQDYQDNEPFTSTILINPARTMEIEYQLSGVGDESYIDFYDLEFDEIETIDLDNSPSEMITTSYCFYSNDYEVNLYLEDNVTGEIKMYLTDQLSGERVLFKYWNSDFTQLTNESFLVEYPYYKNSNLLLSEFITISECDLEENVELSCEVKNLSNYYVERAELENNVNRKIITRQVDNLIEF
jgi:hypothetical protein